MLAREGVAVGLARRCRPRSTAASPRAASNKPGSNSQFARTGPVSRHPEPDGCRSPAQSARSAKSDEADRATGPSASTPVQSSVERRNSPPDQRWHIRQWHAPGRGSGAPRRGSSRRRTAPRRSERPPSCLTAAGCIAERLRSRSPRHRGLAIELRLRRKEPRFARKDEFDAGSRRSAAHSPSTRSFSTGPAGTSRQSGWMYSLPRALCSTVAIGAGLVDSRTPSRCDRRSRRSCTDLPGQLVIARRP